MEKKQGVSIDLDRKDRDSSRTGIRKIISGEGGFKAEGKKQIGPPYAFLLAPLLVCVVTKYHFL